MTLEAAVPRSDRAVVTASRTFARLLGASIGVAAAGSAISNRLSSSMNELGIAQDVKATILDDPASIQHELKAELEPNVLNTIIQAYVGTFKLLFWIVTGLLLFAWFAATALVRSHPLAREDDEEQKEAAKVWLQEEKLRKKKKNDNTGEVIEEKV